MIKSALKKVLGLAAAGLAVSGFAASMQAQTLTETSAETRFQIDTHVPDAALQAMLPEGFTPAAATQGPAKDANLRVIFVDRVSVAGPKGRAVGAGSSQFVYLVAPVKDASGASVQLVLGGLTGDAANVPGASGEYQLAATHTMHREVSSGNGPTLEEQDWKFVAAGGEHFEMHIKFERGFGFHLGPFDVKYYSAKMPNDYEISHQEQQLDILKNVTTNPPDRVKEFSFKGGGGSYAKLFDGKEKLLSWDNILWFNQTVSLP